METLLSRLAKAVAVTTGSPIAGSFTVSKNRSTLNAATVNCPGPGASTGIAVTLPETAGGVPGSGRIV